MPLDPGPALAGVLLWLALASAAAGDTPDLCDSAALRAAGETGVPAPVLLAITRTETGRTRAGRSQPWPWTVNMEGRGVWFDTRAEALDFALRNHARGARSFDVGCFQLNYRWHGRGFASIDAMFDPLEGARYAARFLSRLHGELGDWSRAAGAYHSRTPKYATRYRARFDRLLAGLQDTPRLRLATADPVPRANLYPLLRPGAGAALGSLVPLSSAARPLFGPGG